jgi:hypothetical protein
MSLVPSLVPAVQISCTTACRGPKNAQESRKLKTHPKRYKLYYSFNFSKGSSKNLSSSEKGDFNLCWKNKKKLGKKEYTKN